ncbi:DNA polymerase III subunit delta [Chelatococcus daeguensis]|uniref:DNA polymerase III subunit delta n=1 Tax=Chelatococcus daeguensis TaxID=444444 RepID=UPI0007AB3231|nr:DNA polymerase III subunit delta [Chelatococcus daeguensis]KZE34677.1 DNA polymerase III subunit delta [Chelatococcus daeguensis]MBM3082512.1 DNA polymerase III subunit delta [Chelatococcus daeguensis]
MVAIKAGDVDRAIRHPSPQTAVFLVYGPDSGLVGERVRRLVAGTIDDPDDPFQLVRLDGDEIASDPLRLADEANTVPLFGGRRAIWLRAGSRNLAPALTLVLNTPPQDAVVIVEAGDLSRTAPLRQLCEKAAAAAAMPCYADGVRDLGALIDDMSRKVGLRVEPDARELLLASLGADRVASRSELDKLFTYVHGRDVVTMEDVAAVVGDVSAIAFDAAIDAAFLGDFTTLDRSFTRLQAEGTDADVLLGFALRHTLALMAARQAVDTGSSHAVAIGSFRGLHFKRKAAIERQLRLWATAGLNRAAVELGQAIGMTRRQPQLAAQHALKTLWALAGMARRAAR